MEKQENKTKLTPKQTAVQIVKFVAFSMGAGIIQVVTFTLLNKVINLPYWLSYLPALVLSVLYNFTVNRRYTFKSANNVPIAMLKIAIYYCIFTPVSTYLGDLAEGANINSFLILAVTMICNMTTEFLVCRFWVYRNTINTNSIAKKEEEKQKAEAQQAPKA